MFNPRRFRLCIAILIIAAGCAGPGRRPAGGTSAGIRNYPDTRHGDQVDTYHGVEIADPYRWLEDLDAPETTAWVRAQNEVTFDYLRKLPGHAKITRRLQRLWNYEKYGLPFKHGDRYFYYKNDGLQNQSVLYTMRSLDDPPTVLLDPNTLSADGTVAVSGTSVSENGKFLAYALSSGGSDWMEWHVREVESGQDLPDVIRWSKFSGAAWTHDHRGFYYSRYDEPTEGAELKEQNYYQKLYYHRLGTTQSEDQLIYHRPDQKTWGFSSTVTDDGRYLVISVWRGTERKNLLFYKDLSRPDAPVTELISEFKNQYNFVSNDGPLFWLLTDDGAPRYRVLAVDIRNPGAHGWREVIPQSADTLASASVLSNRFVCSYLTDAHSTVKVFDLLGAAVGEVALPEIGSAAGFGGKNSDRETFYSFTSFTTPGTVYRYDVISGHSEVFRQPQVRIDPDDYVTRQVFYHSKDGTRVPMFITHKRGLVLNGDTPTLLYGYGGFNISLTPSFSVSNTVWLEMGGIYAVPNLRGGGEYGKDWHQAGTKQNKQNVFDDFIAAAEYLISERYTNPQKLAISGRSNGGLLVGACITQRPDLFAVALPGVGVLDMLRFHQYTIGWAWVSDYGSPDNPQEFEALHAYSPVHNVHSGTPYPATLITTADHDDRVYPAHSFKFAAALQDAHQGDHPVLIRIESKAGHGAGKPTSKRIEEAADLLAFTARNLNMKVTLK